jgi:hypothetical protein
MDTLAVRWGLENGEAGLVCESDLGCDALPLSAQTPAFGATLSSAGTTGCASHGASLLLVWPRKSNQKEGHPYIRVLLRKTSLASARLRGSSRRAIPGPSLLARHPCLATPYATPTLSLLKGARDRVVWEFLNSDGSKALQPLAGFVGWKTAKHFPPQSTQRLVSNVARKNRWVSFALPTLRSERGVCCRLPSPARSNQRNALDLALLEKLQATRSGFPFRRPSTGVAQRGSRHGCRERSDGTWMSLRDDPRSNAGARGVLRSKTRMQGWPSFWLLFLGHTRKSDAPCKAQPVGGAEESVTPPYLRPSQNGSYKTPRAMVPPC